MLQVVRGSNVIKDSTDASWKRIGEENPYFGVLSADRFRKENLTEAGIAEFFASGHVHIDKVLTNIRTRFGTLPLGSALDFGCGLGRLVIPLAATFSHVTGIDISPAMLRSAAETCRERGITNITLVPSDDELTQLTGSTFDLIHSYIVLQHIPPQRGEAIIRQLLDRLNPGGILAIQMPFLRKASPARRMVNTLRKSFKPFNVLANLAQKQKWNEPLIQMNSYDLNRILAELSRRGITEVFLEIIDSDLNLQAYIYARKPA
jgi:2-polyprenyl-3-methyl-5-hydroxy-6-metoxy-1,4-benzoquinol methylase